MNINVWKMLIWESTVCSSISRFFRDDIIYIQLYMYDVRLCFSSNNNYHHNNNNNNFASWFVNLLIQYLWPLNPYPTTLRTSSTCKRLGF